MNGYPDDPANDLDTVSSYRPQLISYLIGLGADRDDAEDLAQDVIIGAWERQGKIEPQALAAYIYQSARNEYGQLKLRASNRFEVEIEALGECADIASDPLALEAFEIIYRDDEMRRYASHLVAAFASLCETQREAIIYRYILSRSTQETADLLGTTTNTIKRRVSRAFAHLRNDYPHLADLLDGRDTPITN
ncbi:MAG: sigma-70 family RNA polymerase sigma factor [Alphaproteobacteria bacterium]|nr:MAG: sigma-70 family RNA polymerase sigma factor [Alphaproteobacteria bacterium]